MRVSTILPHLPDISGATGTTQISGAAVALNLALRRYVNDPAIESLELFLAPRDVLNAPLIRRLVTELLQPENAGKGKLEIHSLYALPDLWADGRERVIHTDDLHLLARDRDLRDRYANGPTVIACDTHCMGHRGIVESLRSLVRAPRTSFDRIYAPSCATARSIEATLEWLGEPEAIDIHVQARVIDPTGLAPNKTKKEQKAFRRKLRLPVSGTIAVAFGRMTPATKGDLVVLTELFLDESGPEHHLVIAGHEETAGYGELIRGLAKRRGAARRVHVRGGLGLGSRGDLYRASDILIFPADSGNEVFGLVAVEAMACGLPVIGTDWDGLKDTIEHGVTGFRLPVYEPPALGRFDDMTWAADEQTSLLLRAQATVIDRAALGGAIGRLLTDPELRRSMGRQALEAVAGRLNPDRLFEERLEGFREQLDLARREAAFAACERRERAVQLGLKVPIHEQFVGYGTRALLSPDHRFRTSERGLDAIRSKQPIELFPDVRAVLPAEVVELLLHRLVQERSAADVEEMLSQSSLPNDLALFALGVLCKQGFVAVVATQSCYNPAG